LEFHVKNSRKGTEPIPSMLEEIKDKQRNIVWPDTLRNGRDVDALVFRGSPKATLVQRIGILLFGVALLMMAIAMIDVGKEGNSFAFYGAGIGLLLLGAWVLFNGMRRNKSKRSK
jgi:hypothetical protein